MAQRTLETANGIPVVHIPLGDLPLHPNLNPRCGSTEESSLLKTSISTVLATRV